MWRRLNRPNPTRDATIGLPIVRLCAPIRTHPRSSPNRGAAGATVAGVTALHQTEGWIAIARFRARTHRGPPKHPGPIRHRARPKRLGRTTRHERRRAASHDRLRTAERQSVADRRRPRPTGRHDPQGAGAKDPVPAVTARRRGKGRGGRAGRRATLVERMVWITSRVTAPLSRPRFLGPTNGRPALEVIDTSH